MSIPFSIMKVLSTLNNNPLTRHFLSSHHILTTLYNIGTLDPSEVILLMAGAQPRKTTMWDTALKPRPAMVSGTRKPLWLVAHYALRCKRLLEQARQEAL